MILRLFVFLACLVVVQSYKDLKDFCQESEVLKVISETHPIYDLKNYTCKIELPFFANDNTIAEYMCSYYAPFPTFDVKAKADTVECTYQTNRYCSNGDHLIQGVCIKVVKTNMTYAKYTSSACPPGYKTLKILNRDMARWISTLGVVKKIEGIWIDQATRADSEPTDASNEAKFLNLKLELGSSKIISSILYTNKEKELFGVCVSEEYGTYNDEADSKTKYFLSDNLYSPTSINGYLTNGEDTFRDMDAIGKKLNPKSMLATTIPQGTKLPGMEPNSLVYVGVRAIYGTGLKVEQDCSKRMDSRAVSLLAKQFNAVLHPVGGGMNTTNINSTLFKQNYPNNACSDVPKNAVAYDGTNLINIVPFARLEIACVTGDIEGLKYEDPCGEGGIATNGKCVCKPDWVDITTMKHISDASNYEQGMICVPRSPCKMEEQNNVIIFLIDAALESYYTYESYTGLRNFVKLAADLIHNKTKIIFISYGHVHVDHTYKSNEKILESAWSPEQYAADVDNVINGYFGRDTLLRVGFYYAEMQLMAITHNRTYSGAKRIVIQIGGGELKKLHDYEQGQWVSRTTLGVGSKNGTMFDYYTDGDYTDFHNINIEDLTPEHMRNVMLKACKPRSYDEIFNGA